MIKIYSGERLSNYQDTVVRVDKELLAPYYKDIDGKVDMLYNWGGGHTSFATNHLAMTLLATETEAMDNPTFVDEYQTLIELYALEVVSKLDNKLWVLTSDDINAWLVKELGIE